MTGLDPKVEAAVLAARGLSSDAIGKRIGRTGRTVRRWLEDPEFLARVGDIRRELLRETVAALETAAKAAVLTLSRALDDDSPAIRVRAAVALLAALPRFAEHVELEERVAAIEAQLQGEGEG